MSLWLPLLKSIVQSARRARRPTGVTDSSVGADETMELAERCVQEGRSLEEQGRTESAEIKYLEALRYYPDGAGICVHLGNLYFERHDWHRAALHFEAALRARPNYAGALFSLGRVEIKRDNLTKAAGFLEAAVAADPNLGNAHYSLGLALLNMGFVPEAIGCLRKAIKIDPSNPDHVATLLFALNYASNISGNELRAEHVRHGKQMIFKTASHEFRNVPDADRRLRIGYLSGDLRQHVVARFLEPVLQRHDETKVETFAFHNARHSDSVTARLKQKVHHWRDIAGLSDEAVAQGMASDEIDILVDLAGYTEHNRIAMLARRAAPIQAIWLGYLNTTGLTALDYRICDAYTDPPGVGEEWSVETPARMRDCQWCWPISADFPEVGDLPMLRNGYPTFGSFNNVVKINDRVLGLWARILREIPESRLIVMAVEPGRPRDRLSAIFGQEGIGSDRIDFRSRCPGEDYLLAHNEADVALDPFPYNGGTTSFDSLAMGVPFVTLAGDRPAGRSGVSILSNIGLQHLIARDTHQYVGIAKQLVGDPENLRTLRLSMRARLRASPLCDIDRFTRNLESLYRQWWKQWCDSRRDF